MGTGGIHETPGSETKSSLSQLRTGVSVSVPQVSFPTIQSKEEHMTLKRIMFLENGLYLEGCIFSHGW